MSRPLNVLLFAHGHAGVNSLRSLSDAGHTITACFTHRTTPAWLPSVPDECRRLSVPCSTDPTSADIAPSMADRPHVVLSVGYGRKIEMPYLGLGLIGAFNVAGSPLPQYRGHFPHRWAIINDEPTWGVTVHQMTAGYCDGAILHRKSLVSRPRENAYEFSLRVAGSMAAAAVEAVEKLARGDDHLTSVEPANNDFYGPGLPHDGVIDWHQPAAKLDAFVRALDFGRTIHATYQHLTAPARGTIAGRPIGIYRAHAGGTRSSYPPGTLTRCDEDQVWVQTPRGHLVIERVVIEGRDLDAPAYFTSQGFTPGDTFDTSYSWNAPTPAREYGQAA
jgi:methionyl-tRNA formyltransferase